MRSKISLLGLGSLCTALALQSAAFAEPKTTDNPNGCKVVERKGGTPSGSLSSTVTAGNGRVSASTSGGNGVTVYSGNGSGVATAGTSGNGRSSTMVTTSDGGCIIYVDPGRKEGQK